MAEDEVNIVEQPEVKTAKTRGAKAQPIPQSEAAVIDSAGQAGIAEQLSQAEAASQPPSDPYPNRRKYLDGYVLNLPVDYWSQYTEEEIRERFKATGIEGEGIDARVSLILEAAKFHNVTVGSEDLVAVRQAHEHEQLVATRIAIDAASQGLER